MWKQARYFLFQIVSLVVALAILGKLVALGRGGSLVEATMMTVIFLWGLFFPYFCRMGLQVYHRTHGQPEARVSVALRSILGTVVGALVLICAMALGNSASEVGLLFAAQTGSSMFLGFVAPFTIGLAAGYLRDRFETVSQDETPGSLPLDGPGIIFSADLSGSNDFMRWVYLTFWSIFMLVGLSPMVDNWTGLGPTGISTGLVVDVIALPFVVFLVIKLRAKPGLRGLGVKILDAEHIELVQIEPGARRSEDLSKAMTLVSGKKYPAKRLTVLVNIARRQDREWAVGQLALKGADDQSLIVLNFLTSDRAESRLYVSGSERVFYLGGMDAIEQLKSVSRLLNPLRPRFQLTFTESASDAAATAQLGGAGLGLAGVIAGAADSAIDAARSQSIANQKLAVGELPVDADIRDDLAAIVKQFGYELVSSDVTAHLRQTTADEIMAQSDQRVSLR